MFSGKNLTCSILIGLLFVSGIVAAICAVLHIRGASELRGLQTQAAAIENNRNLIRSLANDAMEYSKKNPAIDPVLQSAGLKPAQALSSPKTSK